MLYKILERARIKSQKFAKVGSETESLEPVLTCVGHIMGKMDSNEVCEREKSTQKVCPAACTSS